MPCIKRIKYHCKHEDKAPHTFLPMKDNRHQIVVVLTNCLKDALFSGTALLQQGIVFKLVLHTNSDCSCQGVILHSRVIEGEMKNSLKM